MSWKISTILLSKNSGDCTRHRQLDVGSIDWGAYSEMAMVEQSGYNARRTSNDRKRSFSAAEAAARDVVDAKRRTVEHIAVSVVKSTSTGSPSYGGVQILSPSHPLHHSHSEVSDKLSHPSHPGSFPRFPEEGYPGQVDHFRDYPLTQQPAGDRRTELNSHNFPPALPKRGNRFNLSRYQLDQDVDEDVFAPPAIAIEPEEKPNRFKTQRERLMLTTAARAGWPQQPADSDEDSRSSSTAPDVSSESQSQSQSQDSYMSQRERLRRFSSEQSRHVVIPNEWEGEQRLQEFVAFGNIEAALRPLGLMMARAALVSDSVTTRHRRSSSTGPSCCHASLSNPRTS